MSLSLARIEVIVVPDLSLGLALKERACMRECEKVGPIEVCEDLRRDFARKVEEGSYVFR
jgi:hypothetical protein